MEVEAEIDRLPIDLLAHIFVMITSFTDLAQASIVCRKWKQGVKQSLARRENLSFSGWKMDDDSTGRLVRHAYSLKELDISRNRWGCQITDDGLYKISLAKCVSNLTSISLWGMTGITDKGVIQLDLNFQLGELKPLEPGDKPFVPLGLVHCRFLFHVDFREGPALPVLDQLIADKKQGTFDFVFVDADKDNHLNYHNRLIELVKVGGLIMYDNTLWPGSVAEPPDASMPKFMVYLRDCVLELNKALAADPRIEMCQLPVGDGVTLCRRID